VGLEGGLPLVAGSYLDKVVGTVEVDLCVDVGTMKAVEEVRYEWEQILVLLCNEAEAVPINTQLKGAIFLLNEEHGALQAD